MANFFPSNLYPEPAAETADQDSTVFLSGFEITATQSFDLTEALTVELA